MSTREIKFYDKNIDKTSVIYDAHIDDKSNWFGDIPPFTCLELNILAICNRTCFFCPKSDREKFPNLKEYISFESYEHLMKQLASVHYRGRISLCGLSEPFIHKGLNRLVQITKQYCPDCYLDIISNGDFLTNENVRELFDSGLDNLKVSMYDGPQQIPKFEKIKGDLNLSDEQFAIRARFLSSDQDFGLTINNRGGSINLPKYNIVPLSEPLKQSCYYPFHKLVIDYNGDCMICPSDWEKKLIVGNLYKQDIFEIWNSEAMKDVRMRLINKDRTKSPCTHCNVHGTLYAKKHFDAWRDYYGVKSDA